MVGNVASTLTVAILLLLNLSWCWRVARTAGFIRETRGRRCRTGFVAADLYKQGLCQ